jgi:CheY-like chemotaxis protein/anti-sigma regulatory factor (Ser/Thr protein kinase)
VVDDEELLRDMLVRSLSRLGYEALSAQDGEQALDMFKAQAFDLVLSDVRMPGMDGLALLRVIKEINPRMPVIMISGESDTAMVVAALKAGAENFIAKPLEINTLAQVIDQALARRCLAGSGGRGVPPARQSTAFSVPSQSEYICDLIEEIGTSAMAVGYAYEGLDNNLKMAIFEALTNAMEHGNGWDADKLVTVEVEIDKKRLWISIKDEGQGFDESCLADPTSEECLLSERGRGVFLMKAIMDEVMFNQPGNEVSMAKYR